MTRSSSIARRYAEAYFALAKEAGGIESWRADLASLAAAFSDSHVASVMGNPRLSVAERTRMGLDVVGKVSAPAQNLAQLLIERRRATILPQILSHFDALADREAGVVRAEVTTALPAEGRLEQQIAAALAKALDRPVETTLRADPSIVGGLVIRIGDRVIDDSVRTHLQQLQAALA